MSASARPHPWKEEIGFCSKAGSLGRERKGGGCWGMGCRDMDRDGDWRPGGFWRERGVVDGLYGWMDSVIALE